MKSDKLKKKLLKGLLSTLIPKRFSNLQLEIVIFPIVILVEPLPDKRRWFTRISLYTVAVKPVQSCGS